MTNASYPLLRLNAWHVRCAWLAAALLSGPCALAQAQVQSQAPAPALQSPPASPAQSASARAAVPLAQSYLPKPSETLDQVIAKILPGSPLKIELLRLALIEQNPQAFKPGKFPTLRKGVPLAVPDHDALLRKHLGAKAPEPEVAQGPAGFTPSTSAERRHWVQFP